MCTLSKQTSVQVDVPHSKPAFETRFQVVSQDRDFNPALSNTRWMHIDESAIKSSGNENIRKLGSLIRKQTTPAAAVAEACRVINSRMTYDASVAFPPSNLAETLKIQRGHCGHYFHLLKVSCEEVGLPVRIVRGLNLNCEDGINSRLHKIRPDYSNVHTWAEVYLSEDGWIEVEPNRKRNPFRIPARFIQNNGWFQNYSVWFKEDGREILHKWARDNGKYHSEFEMANTISFSSQQASLGR